MKDIYVQKFQEVITETWSSSGNRLPPMIHHYVAVLLADHVERTDFFSEPFGIRYMKIDNAYSAKELGDNCLVLVGIFPGYRGMSDEYYTSLGMGAYNIAANATRSTVFEAMSEHFDDIRQGLNQLRPPTFL